jgi:hypothetical protein
MATWLDEFLSEAEQAGGTAARAATEAVIEVVEDLGLQIKQQEAHPNKGSSVAFVRPRSQCLARRHARNPLRSRSTVVGSCEA